MKDSNMPPVSVKRGEIYNVLEGRGTPTGTEIWPNRPAIIVSNEAINEKSGFVTVIYLTTSPKRNMPYHVSVQSGSKVATALCEQVFSVDKSRLGDRIGVVPPEQMDRVDIAIQLSLSTIGVNKTNCAMLVRKWILALEKHGITLLGNPGESDTGLLDKEIRQLRAERDMYRDMYDEQVRRTREAIAAM